MSRQIAAIYENGTLRPLEPLGLEEHQRVVVTIEEAPRSSVEDWIDHSYYAALGASIGAEPSSEESREALSAISGKLSDAVRAERDARG